MGAVIAAFEMAINSVAGFVNVVEYIIDIIAGFFVSPFGSFIVPAFLVPFFSVGLIATIIHAIKSLVPFI